MNNVIKCISTFNCLLFVFQPRHRTHQKVPYLQIKMFKKLFQKSKQEDGLQDSSSTKKSNIKYHKLSESPSPKRRSPIESCKSISQSSKQAENQGANHY